MSIEVHALSRLRVDVEAAGSYLTDGTGTLGNYEDVPCQGVASVTLEKAENDPAIVHQFLDQRSEMVVGRRSWSLSFTMNLASTGTAAGNATAAISDVLGTMLKAVMGAENLSTGTTINDAGAAATDYDLTATTGWVSGLVSGTTISGAVQWRGVKTLAGSNILHSLATTAAPANGSVVYGSANYTFTEDPDTSLQFIVQGAEGNDGWVLLGGQGGFSINIPRSGIPTITFNFSGPYWLHGSESAGSGNLDGYTLAAATYPSQGYALAEAGNFFSWVNGTATYTASTVTTEGSQVHVASETWTVNTPYVDIPSPSGANGSGVIRKRRMKAEVSVSFRCPYQALATWFTKRDNATDVAFFRQIGTAAGSTIVLWAPTTQITNVQRVDSDGMAYQEVTATARHDAETTASGAVQRSIFRLARC